MTRPVVAFDANVLVAGLLSWHAHHALVRPILEDWLGGIPLPIVPIPALIEAWAVMTRLPSPHGVSTADAATLLEGSLRDRCRLVSLAPEHGWRLFDALIEGQPAGGLAYDLHVVRCAEAAGATRLYTCNQRDFDRVKTVGIDVVNPLRPT